MSRLSRTAQSKSQSSDIPQKTTWTKGKMYKLIGQLILLISFLAQNIVFENYNEKLAGLNEALRSESMMDKGAALKEIEYTIAPLSPDTLIKKHSQEVYISEAAMEVAESQIMIIAGLNRPKKILTDMIQNILYRAKTVHDFISYQNFRRYVNSIDVTHKEIQDNIDSVKADKKHWFYAFILLFIIGSVLVSLAVKYES
jgi:hypothetical protein